MEDLVNLQDTLEECPKCGSIHITSGSGYYYDALIPQLSPNRQNYAVCEVACLHCNFTIEKTVPREQTVEAAKDLHDQWNRFSRERFKPDSERSFALYRVARALRVEGNRLLEQAKKLKKKLKS